MGRILKVLAISAHADDFEINCLGAFLRYRKHLSLYQAICSQDHVRKLEQNMVVKYTKPEGIFWGDLKDGYMRFNKDMMIFLDGVYKLVQPDILVTHSELESHQDHKAVAMATRALMRKKHPKALITYEGDNGRIDFKLTLGESKRKVALLQLYGSQKHCEKMKAALIAEHEFLNLEYYSELI